MRADLRWQGAGYPWESPPVGFINWGADRGGQTGVPFLNLPVGGSTPSRNGSPARATSRLPPPKRSARVGAATIDRLDAAPGWQFSLCRGPSRGCGHRSLAQSRLARELSRSRAAISEFALTVWPRRKIFAPPGVSLSGPDSFSRRSSYRHEGDLRIDGRHLALDNATGQFYGGQVSGSFVADLRAMPSYHANLDFARVDMSALIAATPSLAGVSAASGSAQISFDATGATRADLMASLECQGNARVVDPRLVNLDLGKALGSPSRGARFAPFSDGSATFSCAGRKMSSN